MSIRLGEKKKNLLKFRGFFDYGSSKYKSEFLDIYLITKSKFNIGTCSGISYLPIIFKNRNILTNIYTFLLTTQDQSVSQNSLNQQLIKNIKNFLV